MRTGRSKRQGSSGGYLSKMPQVAVMLPPQIKVCRDMRRGVLKYVRAHGPWGLHLIEDRDNARVLKRSPFAYTGIIAQPISESQVNAIASLKVPTVMVDPQLTHISPAHRNLLRRASLIRCATEEVGRFAARHFLSLGFRNFAYVGIAAHNKWSTLRCDGFASEVARAGFSASIYHCGRHKTYADELPHLMKWLSRLPRPCAILCAWDLRARHVIDACAVLGLSVPQDISVLGVDDDEDLCNSSVPPIPSIRLDAERAGYVAAHQLDNLLCGISGRHVIEYGPKGVTNRVRPPGLSAHDDSAVDAALEYIALNAVRGIRVTDVARVAGLSVRMLERRFAKAVKISVSEAILNRRLEQAKAMLADPNVSVKSVALSCGFGTSAYFSRVFSKRVGSSPGAFARQLTWK